MTPVEALLHLRMLEIALLLGCFYWILFYQPHGRVRTIRLWLTAVFGVINLAAVVVATSWAGVTLW